MVKLTSREGMKRYRSECSGRRKEIFSTRCPPPRKRLPKTRVLCVRHRHGILHDSCPTDQHTHSSPKACICIGTTSTYRKQLQQFAMLAAMSRKGDCWDNAPMESSGVSEK